MARESTQRREVMTDELPNIRRALKGEAPDKSTKLVPVLVTLDWANLPYHRLANEYDMEDEHEQAAITESIKANGVLAGEQVTLCRAQGKVVETTTRCDASCVRSADG